MHNVEFLSHLDDTHLEQLPELLRAATCADGHEPVGEHKFLRLQRADDLAVAMVARERGELVGYAHTLTFDEGDARRVSCEVVVRPDRRQRGIGQALLAKAMEHARAQNARRIDVWAYNDSAASRRLAAELGFRPRRRLLHLHRHMHDVIDASPAPGVTLRSFRVGEDEERWLALNNRIFSGHPENGRWTRDDLDARVRQPWFNANDFLLVESNGALSGFCWLKIEEGGNEGGVGEIYVIGTAPETRGIGLGRYLLARALHRLRERQARVAAIYVDESNSAAVGLYESSGFHYHHVDVCYSLDISLEVATTTRKAEAAA
jgi:mycothiol synthase